MLASGVYYLTFKVIEAPANLSCHKGNADPWFDKHTTRDLLPDTLKTPCTHHIGLSDHVASCLAGNI